MDKVRKNEIIAIVLFAIGLFLFLSIFTFSEQDLPFFTSNPNSASQNTTGIVGAYIGGILIFFLGKASYVLPLLALVWGISRILQMETKRTFFKLFGSIILLGAVSSGLSMVANLSPQTAFNYGGLIGTIGASFLLGYLGKIGSVVFISAMITLSLLIATEFLILPIFMAAFSFLVKTFSRIGFALSEKAQTSIRDMSSERGKLRAAKEEVSRKLETMREAVEQSRRTSFTQKPAEKSKAKLFAKGDPEIVAAGKAQKIKGKPLIASGARDVAPGGEEKEYKLPSINLLKTPQRTNVKSREEDLKKRAGILERTLFEFGVEAKVVKINTGPVITMYELEPAVGTKVNRITSLSDNISLAMKSTNIRIVAPLPGKGTIGIEVPNEKSELVLLKDILESEEYTEEDAPLKLALGRDISGVPIVTDLGKMPHLLIAGATGSGKTVCLNSIISSFLFNSTPDDLKFLMIDPKRVELMIFEDIPHLVCPIVTNPKKAANALEWVVSEMDRRYEMFAEKGVRNITIYKERRTPEEEDLPYIVVVVDELADLMMIAQQDVEGAIMRIAQLSRAAGIHMILATQRPSVNVVTGVVKANFPARISFKVASKVDSRTVLDTNGAEKLLGRGDMLLMEPGQTSLIRVQCSLVEDSEIRSIVKFVKSQTTPEYIEEAIAKQEKKITGVKQEKDELYDEAVKIVLGTKQASVSMLQRKLRIGYTRAARMIDIMEEEGIVGAYSGSKPRQILVDNLEVIEE